MKQGIYSITHIETGRRYIGSSVNIARRWAQHRSAIRKGVHPAKHLMHAFQKHGADAFAFDVLEHCDVTIESVRIERENYWIALLKPEFNVAPVAGSNAGMKHTPETLANMKKSRTVAVRAAIGAAQKGRVKSESELAKLSAARKGRTSPRKGVTLSEETKAKISRNRSGIARSPEANRMAAQALRGQKRTVEQRQRMSAAQKGRTFSDETKVRMSLAAKAYLERKRAPVLH